MQGQIKPDGSRRRGCAIKKCPVKETRLTDGGGVDLKRKALSCEIGESYECSACTWQVIAREIVGRSVRRRVVRLCPR